MGQEEDIKLLDFLASLGFKRNQMESQVKALGDTFKSEAVLKYIEHFGKETMFFDLHLRYDRQFNAYRLDRYKATHRREVSITHAVINEVDTKHLETRMAMENWDAYFLGDHSNLNAHDKAYIKETLALLDKLSIDQNFDGMHVKESLMFKYWPLGSYDHPSKFEFQMVYEQSSDFNSNSDEIVNVNLAYYLVSGKLDSLYNGLQHIGLDEFTDIDLYEVISFHLAKNLDKFDIYTSNNQGEGFIDFKLTGTKTDYGLEAETYQLKLTPHPVIEHGVYHGVDTEELEALMNEINWRNSDAIYSLDENRTPELIYTSEMAEVMRQLQELSTDKIGAEIVVQLQLKYYRSNDVLNELLEDEVLEYLNGVPAKEYEFATDVPIKAAYNLLSGRAVLENMIHSYLPSNDNWIRLDLSNREPEVQVATFSPDEFENLAVMLPIVSSSLPEVLYPLVQGSLVTTMLKDGRSIILEANPKQKTINIYTPDMQLIPMNLGLDPDWKPKFPEEHAVQQQSEIVEKKGVNFRVKHLVKKSRGKGL